jgi:hypothetical protein
VRAGAAVLIGAATMAAVAAEKYVPVPSEFFTATLTRRNCVSCALVRTKVLAVALLIAVQPVGAVAPLTAPLPAPVQLNQAYVVVGEGAATQIPAAAVRVWPTFAVPETVGTLLFTGRVPATAVVVGVITLADPMPFIAVTLNRRNLL